MEKTDSSNPGSKYSRIFASLNDLSLKSSIRLMILISLGMNRKLNFSDLLKLTGTGKGSLHNHISRLESAGYIKTTRYSFFSSPKLRVEITEKGKEVVQRYLESISDI